MHVFLMPFEARLSVFRSSGTILCIVSLAREARSGLFIISNRGGYEIVSDGIENWDQ